jgi:hypothetical protein
MREELENVLGAVEAKELPPGFDQLFGKIWDAQASRFNVQETYVLDFKETVPDEFSKDYGAGIVRLALAFFNSYGGLIIFGVKDRALTVVGTDRVFDIEKFNRLLTDVAEVHAECLLRSYTVTADNDERTIVAVLVPKRGMVRPARLIRDFGPYRAGTLWVRDRHEAMEAELRHLPVLYSDRETPPDSPLDDETTFPVHRSFPPSPALLKHFVNRGNQSGNLIETLWDWFVFREKPRFYLHGAGGSGKSTLAYVFARMLADHGHAIRSKDGQRLDYVIYISGKETEFNPQTRSQQVFALRQFGSRREQFEQILFHAGFADEKQVDGLSGAKLDEKFDKLLSELFAHFSGLIVIDDIDALTRRKVDSGEESLFLKAAQPTAKHTRVLYTLRFPPAHAMDSTEPVPGLHSGIELPEFAKACARQFGVPEPTPDELKQLDTITDCLPLLLETVIALRKHSGTYKEAIRTFNDKGGEDARRYLYQREYDGLQQQGRARQLLAALYLVGEPMSVPALAGLLQFQHNVLTDAISECSSVFLSTQVGEDGETLYQLTPPCVPFVENISKQLTYFAALQRKVQHFNRIGVNVGPREAGLIVNMERLIRSRSFSAVAAMGEQLKSDDLALENPKIRSLLGQAYSELGGHSWAKARECFKHAEGLGHRDVFMMRRWFHLEFTSGYGWDEAERICRAVLDEQGFGPRVKSEFWSKLGSCLFMKANGILGVSREKGLELLRQSIYAYLEGIWIGRSAGEMDIANNFAWLEKPLRRFVLAAKGDIDQFFALFDGLPDRKHDVDDAAVDLILGYLTKSRSPTDKPTRARLKGLSMRSISKISRSMRPASAYPGFAKIVETLKAVVDQIDADEKASASSAS